MPDSRYPASALKPLIRTDTRLRASQPRAPIAGELIVWFPRMKACISSRVRRPSSLACIALKLFPRAAASHRERFRSLSGSGGERREVVHTLG
jgi:hypothetical protein